MINQTLLTDNLPDLINFNIFANARYDNPGSSSNEPSTFNFLFDSSYYLSEFGIFDGFCIQPWMYIDNGRYTADLYYITEDFSISTNVDLNQDLNVDETFYLTDELVQAATFVLNNLSWEQLDADAALEGVIRDDAGNILNPTDVNGNYIYLESADVQLAVWDLIYGIYAPDYGGGGIFDETPYGVRALDATTNAILKSNIAPHAANYVADEAGDKLGFILKPTSDNQYIFSTIELPAMEDYTWLDTDEDGIQDAGSDDGTSVDETDKIDQFSPTIAIENQDVSPPEPVPVSVPESSSIMGLLAIAILITVTRLKLPTLLR